jgi:hypothetical protein
VLAAGAGLAVLAGLAAFLRVVLGGLGGEAGSDGAAVSGWLSGGSCRPSSQATSCFFRMSVLRPTLWRRSWPSLRAA